MKNCVLVLLTIGLILQHIWVNFSLGLSGHQSKQTMIREEPQAIDNNKIITGDVNDINSNIISYFNTRYYYLPASQHYISFSVVLDQSEYPASLEVSLYKYVDNHDTLIASKNLRLIQEDISTIEFDVSNSGCGYYWFKISVPYSQQTWKIKNNFFVL